jgi:hypothetical protein
MVFASIMIIPLFFYVGITFWMPRCALEAFQFLAGLLIFTLGGPFLNIVVTIYALCNMDNFGWGKTRTVVAETETGEAEEPDTDAQSGFLGGALESDEKGVVPAGTNRPDEENQMSRAAMRTIFTASPPPPGS